MTEEKKKSKEKVKNLVGTRGRIFQGKVVTKFPNRISIEFERPVYVKKYERFYKKKTKIHARLPESLSDVKIGDIVKVQECRPLSKILHAVVIEIVKKSEEEEK
ncbi:30S ribosomal protein S17 [Candidatus Pacearchaeota archaeon]|nr:30S ribosomal protein S17 [Candidatus Pacearchaeota archaeon]|tara:strand:+ start:111 stop:422 length:312 start_codon:yes stop_codon:yes gene_type:complete